MTKEKLFFSGHFMQITQDRVKPVREDLAYLVAALAMTGEVEHAEKLVKNEQLSLVEQKQFSFVLFFLGLGFTRASNYKKAKIYFLQLNQQRKNSFDKFLLAQGLGFYNYFICRYNLAEKWISVARSNIDEDKWNKFWILIFSDLAAHIFVKRGKVNLGIKLCQKAHRLAIETGNKFAEEASVVALANYDSMYGADQKNSLVQLKKLISKYESSNNFYYFNLLLEYVRRLNLSGQFTLAEEILNKIKGELFQSNLNRQKALWGFRSAHLLFLQGKPQALNQIESALDYLQSRQDLSLRLQLLGLKYKISKLQNQPIEDLEKEIKKLTFFCRDSQALSYAYRYGWYNKPVSEDPYAGFFHSWLRDGYKNYAMLKKVTDKNWLALFCDLLPVQRQNFLYLDVLPKKGLIFSESGISLSEGLTPLVRQSLLLLSRQTLSKKDFVEMLWGYQYDAYRHDSLVYTLLGRIRDFFTKQHDLVMLQQNTIALNGLQVRVYDHQTTVADKITVKVDTTQSEQLNFRQVEILEYLEQNRFISTQEASQFLQTTIVTASRDLVNLHKQNRISKSGRGRAIRYALPREGV